MRKLLEKENKKQMLLKKLGYDIPRSRSFILAKSRLAKGSLLEVGTGKGHFTVTLAEKGFLLTSIDLDPVPQKLARKYLRQKRLQKKARILVMDAERLKFPDGSFDSVVSVNFMHHAKKPYQCLAEMIRVVKNKVIIADVNKKGEKILERIHNRDGYAHPRCLAAFSAMRDFLNKRGFVTKTYKGFCQTIIVAERRAK